MKPFKISCFDKEKNLIGEQSVSMSSNDVDTHKISFVGENNTVPFVIDIENHELIIDNTNGDFDEITQDKPIARIKVSNIRLDYEENITFSLDDSQTSYKITGNTFEKKQGSNYVPVKTYDKMFDVVLPSTLFADMDADKININGFPFQMFEALTEQDKTDLGIETFQSSSKLLNIIKYKDQMFIARGKKFIPVSPEHQNYYKIGDESVFGLTIGRNNGVSGKQSQGIAFKMPEAELEDVAKFINGSLDGITFKNQDALDSNDIDYRRINKQSDLEKITTGITPGPVDPIDPDPVDPDPIDPDPVDPDPVDPGPIDPPPINPEPKPEKKPKEDKKEEKKPEPEKITAGLGYLCSALALATACFLISGIFLGPVAWFFFSLFTLGAITNFTISGVSYGKKQKRSKQQKIIDKINKLQKQLDKLKDKEPNKKITAKMQKLQNKINKEQGKLDALNPQSNTPVTSTPPQEPTVDENTTRITPTTDESVIDTEMTNRNATQQNTNNNTTTNVNQAQKDTIHSTLDSVLKNKPTSIEERNTMINGVNSQVLAVCPDGTDASNVPEADKDFIQNCINFRTAYIAEQSAKETHEQALANGNPDEILITELAYQEARDNVNVQLNNLYNSSTERVIPAPVVEPPDAGRNA